MTTVSPDDEQPHLPDPDAGPDWCESWWYEVVTADGAGVAVRLVTWPAQARTWYWAHVALPDATRIAVRDHDLPPPAPGRLLVRGDQLWADHLPEEPLAFWTIGLETYGVRVDDPVEALESEYGERMPIAFEIDMEALTRAIPLGARAEGESRDGGGSRGAVGYEQVCAAHGEVHVGPSTTYALAGRGARGHSWGEPPWWRRWGGRATFLLGDALAAGVLVPGEAGAGGLTGGGEEVVPCGYVWSAEDVDRPVESLVSEVHGDTSGLPVAGRLVVDSAMQLDFESEAIFPVRIGDWGRPGEGEGGHVLRCLCRVRTGEGVEGAGWSEWVRPAPGARG